MTSLGVQDSHRLRRLLLSRVADGNTALFTDTDLSAIFGSDYEDRAGVALEVLRAVDFGGAGFVESAVAAWSVSDGVYEVVLGPRFARGEYGADGRHLTPSPPGFDANGSPVE